MPTIPTIYFGDQIHVPYGQRTLEQVREFSFEITRFLIDQGAGMIVVACNAASAASLHFLREKVTGIPFVGMEPAIKPAVETTHSGVVGVLATKATFQGALYASVVERFGQDVKILQDTCPGLVTQIEAGKLNDPETRDILTSAINPMLELGIDTIVLGCTHYPFVIPLIQEIAGVNVRVIDPAPAVARQVQRVYPGVSPISASQPFYHRYITSRDQQQLALLISQLIGLDVGTEHVEWSSEGKIMLHQPEKY